MEIYCTRPGCPRPVNQFTDLDDSTTLKTVRQKYCLACGMQLFLQERYLPIKLLGRGGFGAAFLARDRYTPKMRKCVVKQFQPAGNITATQLQKAQEMFEREGETLEELGVRHREIPDLYAFFELDVPSRTAGQAIEKFFYLVQEFVDGQTLEEELAQKGKFSEAEVLDLLQKILPILKFIHENEVIHRDIKPSNIMRHRDGRIYLLDFGAVRQVASAPDHSTGIYTPGFAPPEQMTGGKLYPCTDLYALAATCLVLLTGKSPSELFDTFHNNWNWRAYTQVSDRLEAVLNRLLQFTPSQRFQSADEVLAALTVPAPRPAPVPPTAVQPVPVPAPPPVRQPKSPLKPVAPFSTLELLGSAAFTGFEGGLLAIVLSSILGTAVIPVFWLLLLAIVGGLIFAQSKRWIERLDLAIVSGVTLAAVAFVPVLHQVLTGLPLLSQVVQAIGGVMPAVVFLAVLTALVSIAVTIVFRLFYRLFSRLL